MSGARPKTPPPELVKQRTDPVAVNDAEEKNEVDEHKEDRAVLEQLKQKGVPDLVIHIAAMSGLKPSEIGTGKKVEEGPMVETLQSIGFPQKDATTTASAVMFNAKYLKRLGNNTTPEQLAAHTMHSPTDTGGFNHDGTTNHQVLDELDSYAINLPGREPIVTPEHMNEYRAKRIEANKKANNKTCADKIYNACPYHPIDQRATDGEVDTTLKYLSPDKEGITLKRWKGVFTDSYGTLWDGQKRQKIRMDAEKERTDRLAAEETARATAHKSPKHG